MAPTTPTTSHTLTNLPTELTDEILAVLPVVDLAKLRGISRDFRGMIDEHRAIQCQQRIQREKLRLEASYASMPSFAGLTLDAALRKCIRWNGGVPSIWEYGEFAKALASCWEWDNGVTARLNGMDDDVAYVLRPYYAWAFEALLLIDMELRCQRYGLSAEIHELAFWPLRFGRHLELSFGIRHPSQLSLQAWEGVVDAITRHPLEGDRMSERDKDGLEDDFWTAVGYEPAGDDNTAEEHSRRRERSDFLERLGLPSKLPSSAFRYVPTKRAAHLARMWTERNGADDGAKDETGLALLKVAFCEEMKILPSLSSAHKRILIEGEDCGKDLQE